jgi:hypothetical protein
MTGTSNYLGYEVTYDLDDARGGAVAGSLVFESESAPIHKFAETDRDPNAPYRELALEDGTRLRFRVVGTEVKPHIVRPGHALIVSIVRVAGRIDAAG